MQGDNLRVNGNTLSWGSLAAKVNGETINGWTALNYEHSRERTHTWGMGAHQAPRGRTRGKYTPGTVKLTGYKSSVAALKAFLAKEAGGNSYGNAEFEIVLSGVEDDETPITVEILRCVIVKVTANHEEGADALKEDIEVSCMRIVENGLSLADVDTDPTP